MLKAQLRQLDQLVRGTFQQAVQALVNAVAPVEDGCYPRPAQQAAFGPGMPVSYSVVIRVELITPAWIAGLVAFQVGLQQKGFEEPGGVGEVPFRRAGVCHALQAQIFGLQRMDQRLTVMAHLLQLRQQHNVPTSCCCADVKGQCGFVDLLVQWEWIVWREWTTVS